MNRDELRGGVVILEEEKEQRTNVSFFCKFKSIKGNPSPQAGKVGNIILRDCRVGNIIWGVGSLKQVYYATMIQCELITQTTSKPLSAYY